MPRPIAIAAISSVIALTIGIGGTALAYEEAVIKPRNESNIEFVGSLLGQIDELNQEKADWYASTRVCGETLIASWEAFGNLEAAYDNSRNSVDDFFTRGDYRAGDAGLLYTFLSITDDARYSSARSVDDARQRFDECLGQD